MNQHNNWDIIVIGAGAAGAVLAHELTADGKSVLMLEAGSEYRDHSSQFIENELAMWERTWDNGAYTWSGDGFTGAPNLGYGVGGGTLVWTSISLRFFSRDFRMRSIFGPIEGANIEDWPIDLQDLESYYSKAESQMGVSGGMTPWHAPSQGLPPNPSFGYYRSSAILQQGMDKLGIRCAPGAVAVNSQQYDGRETCLHCGFCRSGCRIDAKYQADKTLLDRARQTGLLEIRSLAVATKIELGRSPHRAKGVHYLDKNSGVLHFVRGKIIVLANNPIEIPRLLLNSACESHPYGLGNRHDQVGRNFFCHPSLIGVGVTEQCINGSAGYSMGNIVSLDFCTPPPNSGHVGGFSFQSLNGAGAGVLAVDPYRHLWGRALKSAMTNYNNSVFFIAFCEGLPVRSNRVTVNQNNLDKYGQPKAHIHYQLHDLDKSAFAAALSKSRAIAQATGAHEVHITDTPFEAHPAGTMRMGHSPTASATNQYGRLHDLHNVFVAGSALFPTGSSVNPTLTLHALALRTAEHIKQRFHRLTLGGSASQ